MLLPARLARTGGAPGNRQHAVISELLQGDGMLCKKTKWKRALLLNTKMSKSAASIHITQNYIYTDVNSILDLKMQLQCHKYDYFILSASFYYCKETREVNNWPSWVCLIHLRWYESLNEFSLLKPNLCRRRWGRDGGEGLEVDYWFPFLFRGQRNGRLMGWDIYLDPFHSAIIRL